MIGSTHKHRGQTDGARPRAMLTATVAAACAFGLSLAGVALATGSLTVGSASNAKLGKLVAVNAQGRTLYVLSPETAHHLLCKSSECLKFWPPLTVSSRETKLKAGSGVHGSLRILRRSNGVLQVTLRGLPLYRYSGDHAGGQTNGQGIHSFGGTWHAMTASTVANNAPPASAPGAPSTPGYYGESATSGAPPTTPTPASTPTTSTPTSTTPSYPKEEKKESPW
jgi:predicted lipoprotein with Yx(FWY)xxD motif